MASAETGDTADALRVEVAYSPGPGVVETVALCLPPGTTLGEALAASGLAARHPSLLALPAGVWGRVLPPETLLRDRDRVEVYRPLVVDPKEARRRRQRQPAERGTPNRNRPR